MTLPLRRLDRALRARQASAGTPCCCRRGAAFESQRRHMLPTAGPRPPPPRSSRGRHPPCSGASSACVRASERARPCVRSRGQRVTAKQAVRQRARQAGTQRVDKRVRQVRRKTAAPPPWEARSHDAAPPRPGPSLPGFSKRKLYFFFNFFETWLWTMGEIDLPPFRVRVCVYLRHGALRCAPLMHAARAPGACQQEMQVAEIEFRR